MIAALYVQKGGAYYGLDDVDPWDEERDARLYAGPWPVVAHPPCERWGRFWHGSPMKPHAHKRGDDGGCFEAALSVVRAFGGVIEHPEASAAWYAFGLRAPPRCGGWVAAGDFIGYTCCVEQGHYGHLGRKATWLYTVATELPSLRWGSSGQRLLDEVVRRHGYEKARRAGALSYMGKNRAHKRAATPIPFRDLLLSIARTAAVKVAA